MATATVAVRNLSSQDNIFTVPVKPPTEEVREFFSSALALAGKQIVVDGDLTRCKSCPPSSFGGLDLIHASNCPANRVLLAWEAFKRKVGPPPSSKVQTPLSAA